MQFLLKLLFIYSVLVHGVPTPANTVDPTTTKTVSEAKAIVTQTKSSVEKININSADINSLQTLKGIGPKRAQAIIEYRSKNGVFTSVDDLGKVKGLNPGFIAQLLKDNPDKISIQ